MPDPELDTDDYPHTYDDERCEMCDALIEPACGDCLECSACGCPGCPRCLISWDDVYNYLCPECAGMTETTDA